MEQFAVKNKPHWGKFFAMAVAFFLFLLAQQQPAYAAGNICTYKPTAYSGWARGDIRKTGHWFLDRDNWQNCGGVTPGPNDEAIIPDGVQVWIGNKFIIYQDPNNPARSSEVASQERVHRLKKLVIGKGAALILQNSDYLIEQVKLVEVTGETVIDGGKLKVEVPLRLGGAVTVKNGGRLDADFAGFVISQDVAFDGDQSGFMALGKMTIAPELLNKYVNLTVVSKNHFKVRAASLTVPSSVFIGIKLQGDFYFETLKTEANDAGNGPVLPGSGTLELVGLSWVEAGAMVNGGKLFIKDQTQLKARYFNSNGFVQISAGAEALVTGNFVLGSTGRLVSYGSIGLFEGDWTVEPGAEFTAPTGIMLINTSNGISRHTNILASGKVILNNVIFSNTSGKEQPLVLTAGGQPASLTIKGQLQFTGKNNVTIGGGLAVMVTGDVENDGTLEVRDSARLITDGKLRNTGQLKIDKPSGGLVRETPRAWLADGNGKPLDATILLPKIMFVTVTDGSRNRDGAKPDTVQAYMYSDKNPNGAGWDEEKVMLTETGPATGVFRSADQLIAAALPSPADKPISNDKILSAKPQYDAYFRVIYTDPDDAGQTAISPELKWESANKIDLVPGTVSAAIDPVGTSTVHFFVANEGNASSVGFITKLLFRGAEPGKELEKTVPEAGGLAAGETKEYILEISSADMSSLGTADNLAVTVDSANAVDENNENNNVATVSFAAALDIDNIHVRRTLKKSGGIKTSKQQNVGTTITFLVKNTGALASDGYTLSVDLRTAPKNNPNGPTTENNLYVTTGVGILGQSQRRFDLSFTSAKLQALGIWKNLKITVTPKK